MLSQCVLRYIQNWSRIWADRSKFQFQIHKGLFKSTLAKTTWYILKLSRGTYGDICVNGRKSNTKKHVHINSKEMQTFEHPNEMKIHRNYSLPLCSRKSEIYKTKISQKIKYKTQIPTVVSRGHKHHRIYVSAHFFIFF